MRKKISIFNRGFCVSRTLNQICLPRSVATLLSTRFLLLFITMLDFHRKRRCCWLTWFTCKTRMAQLLSRVNVRLPLCRPVDATAASLLREAFRPGSMDSGRTLQGMVQGRAKERTVQRNLWLLQKYFLNNSSLFQFFKIPKQNKRNGKNCSIFPHSFSIKN